MGFSTITVNGREFKVYDQNIISDEVAFSTFSGYMAFSGTLSREVLNSLDVVGEVAKLRDETKIA